MKTWEKMFLIILVVGALLSSLIYPMHQDEKYFFEIGQGLLNGKLPYVDYFDNKPPGIYVVMALAQWFLGQSIFGPRLLVMGSNVISAWLFWRLVKKEQENDTALLVATSLLIILPLYQGQFALTETLMLPWIILSAIGLLKRKFWMSGLCLGIALLFKQSAFISLIATLGFLGIVYQSRLKNGIILIGGFLLPMVVVFGLLKNVIPLANSAWWVWGNLLFNYPPQAINHTITMIPNLLLPLGILILCILYTIYIRYYDNLLLYSLIVIIASIPILIYRPYHHYWIQFLPFYIYLGVSSPLLKYIKSLFYIQLFFSVVLILGYPFFNTQ